MMRIDKLAQLMTFCKNSIIKCLLLMAIVSTQAFGQQAAQDLQQQFISYQQQAPQEKLFIHTDKNFYLTGETIWFKIYHADASSHKYTDLSKVAYVELLDHEAKPVLQAKIGLGENNGSGNGSLLLPAYINSGSYVLRAYTSWMKNFDEAYFFQKTLSIVNTSKRPDWQSLEKTEAINIHFFPEGGNMVYGLESRVAFQLTDQYGKGLDAAGIIVNERNDTVSRFQSFKFGIGNFYFKPIAGSNYKAWVKLNNGKMIAASLPQIYQQGYVMHVTEIDKEKLRVTVSTAGMVTKQMAYLLAHTRQEIKMALAQSLSNGKAEWIIDKNLLGEGVSNFTIFNENRQPVCERLYFKRPYSKLNIDLKPDQAEYKTRSKVNLGMLTQNEKAQPVKGNLSVSVFRIDSLQSPDLQTIEHYFWLTSDLKGTIESPAYYFSPPSEAVGKALDNLMLTHGWRRFRWEDIAINKKPVIEFLPEYEGLTINTRITQRNSGRPAPGVLSYLSFPGQQFQVSNAISNENGQARFVVRNIFGPQELVMQTDSNSNRYQMELADAFAPKPRVFALSKFLLPETWKDQLNYHHLNTRISNSFQPVQVQQFILPSTSDTSVFYGQPDRRYDLDDFTRFPTMEEVMREFIDVVRVKKDKEMFRYDVLNLPAKLHFNTDPLVLLDGIPVFDVNRIISFDPLKIKKIEVITRKYFWGNIINNGIVSYSTYEGDLAGFELDPSAVIVAFQGLQLQREFYQPDYSTADKRNSRVPDLRTVLFWSAELMSDAQGRVESSFYTSDLPGNYVVIVQGLDSSGVPGSRIIVIPVKE